MMRSMFAAVSGLRSHQQMMDVVGNNIANVNTAGYKSSRVVFQDTLSQLIKGGSGADLSAGQGGVNSQQIGLGVQVGAIDTVNTQGAIQSTGRNTDVAIQGEGFFVVRSGAEQLYTRAGAFGFDSAGDLTDPSGYIVQGYLADAKGAISTTTGVQDVRLPLGQAIPPQETKTVTLGGNLSSETDPATPVVTPIDVYDKLGTAHKVSFSFTHGTDGGWTMEAKDEKGASLGTSPVTFGPDGKRTSPDGTTFAMPGGAAGETFAVDLGKPDSPTALTGYAGGTSAKALDQDGSAPGFLRSFSISDDGTVSGVFSNGRSRPLAKLALASFSNPGGMVRVGDSHLRADNNSGIPNIGAPGGIGKGSLAAGSLEMSNVDLGQEFTNLIIAQRGFQANSRVITTSDELLQDLVNLKR